MSDATSRSRTPVIKLQLFGRSVSLAGRTAGLALLFLLGLTIGFGIYLAVEKPAVLRSALLSPLWLSGALWLAMIVYWNSATKRSAAIRTAESRQSRERHQLLLNTALLLAFIPWPFLRARWLPASWWTVLAGLAIQASAMRLDLWSMRCLGRNWSGAVTIKVEHQLIRTGPYRLVRHPIYTAMIGMFLGTAVVSGELHALAAVVVCAVAYGRKIRLEERGLREAFGDAYEVYRRESWALIPWVI